MVDYSGKHLGRKPAIHDPAVPMLMSLISGAEALAAPPDQSNWYQAVAEWPMDNNDTEPDCTSAAVAHAIQQWTTYGQGMSLIMQAAAVLGFYQLTKAPGDEGGAFLIDVMKFWMTTGIQTGFGLHKIAAFAKIEPGNITHTKCAVAWFGNLVIGLSLPIAAQSQDVWIVVSGAAGKAGTWGGHCVLIVGYDKEFIYFVSWGRVMQMTWEFYEAYCDEAYVALTVSWMKPPGVSPSGFNWSGLEQAMDTLKLAA
jgi:hypothetical protein